MEGLVPGEPRSGRWGFALAAGDLDNDGRDDLAVGTETSFQQVECIGGVHALFGGRAGIGLANNQALTQDTVGIRGDGEIRRCDHFGYSLGIADLNGRGPEELMIGEPQHRRAAVEDIYGAGGLHLLYPNRRQDLAARGYRFLTQDSRGVRGDGAEVRDALGANQLQG
jgi:hypothetical protein